MKVNTNINPIIKNHSYSVATHSYHMLLGNNPLPVFIALSTGEIIYSNSAAQKSLGYDEREFLSLRLQTIFGNQDVTSIPGSAVNENLEPNRLAIHSGKGVLNVEVYFHLIEDDAQSHIQVTIAKLVPEKSPQSILDIDAYRPLLLNAFEEAVIILNKEYKVVLFNPLMEELSKSFLKTPLQIGLNIVNAVDPESRPFVTQTYNKALAGERVSFEFAFEVNGELNHFFAIHKPMVNDKGEIIGLFIITSNITDSKLKRESVLKTEERWRFALEGSNQGVWDWNIKTDEAFFSLAWKRLLGYEEHEISNHISEWSCRLHPDDKRMMDEMVHTHLESSNPYHESEYRLQKKDGSFIWILARGMIVEYDNNLQASRMIGTHTDITERKQIEENYRLLFDNNPIPMWTVDRQTFQFIEVNEAAVQHYGYRREEFAKMTIFDIRLKDDADGIKRSLAIHTGSNKEREVFVHKKKNGDLIHVAVTVKVFVSNGRKINLVLAEDVSEKLEAERKLSESEKQYRLLFDNNPLPSFIYDPATLNFLEANKAMVDHYGYSREEFLQMTVLDLHLPQDAERVKESIKKNRSHKNIVVTTWSQRKKSGEEITVEISRNAMMYNGIAARLIVVKDITEKVKVESAYMESNERFHYVTKATSDMIWDWDIQDNRILWSDNYKRLTGWKLPDDNYLTLDACISKFHPDDRERVEKGLKEILADKTKKKWKDEFRYLKADGTYAYVRDRGYIVRDEEGNARRVIGAMQNITDIKLKEQQLIDINKRHILTTKATSDIIWDWDLVTNELTWNDNFEQIFGWKRKEINIENWELLIHRDDRKRIQKSIKAAFTNERTINWKEQYLFKSADGQYRNILDRGFIERDKNGKPIRFIGAMQDITDIKEKEHELAITNERLGFVTQATSDIIWDWYVKKEEVVVADNYQKVFGWPLQKNKTVSVVENMARYHPEDVPRILAGIHKYFADPKKNVWEDEVRYLKADGTYAHVHTRALLIRDEQGRVERVIGATQDISERKYQEDLQSLELRVFEVSAVPDMQFHNVLKTLIDGFETLHADMRSAICLLNLNDEIEILAPRLTKEQCRQLRYFSEKQKNRLLIQQNNTQTLTVSHPNSEDWKYGDESNKQEGWKVCWNVPVYHHNGDLLSFFTIFLNEDRSPSTRELNTLARLRNLLRILTVNHLSLEQIRLSNERYNNVLKATHDMVWDWNLETGTFYRNVEGLKKVYGTAEEQAIQNVYSWMERIHPADHVKVQQVINDILHATDQDTFDVEYRFKKDDGTYSFIYDRGIIVRNAEGKPLRMIGAAQNITDRIKLEQELLQKELERQKSISQATIDTQEEERREIGKELHDNVNQVLTTTKLYLDLSISSPELKDELIKKSSKNIIYVINEIRQLSRSLMDPSIGDLGLIDSINDLVENINITRKLHVSLSADPDLERYVDESQKLMIFRILQEAMNNTIKYAQATSVQINIKRKNKQLEMQITDDGIGFNPETVKKGAGLKNIQNRVYLTNGKLVIDSAPGKGCKINIHFPINIHKQSN